MNKSFLIFIIIIIVLSSWFFMSGGHEGIISKKYCKSIGYESSEPIERLSLTNYINNNNMRCCKKEIQFGYLVERCNLIEKEMKNE